MKYTATYLTMGRKHTAEGTTALEAIDNLKLKGVKMKGVLTIEHGKEKKERIITPYMALRLFNSVGLNREVALKNITMMFQGI